ncbi:FtsK/SpoIIIE domain-containing protein, partial [Streptococcus dentapri]
EEQGIEAHTIYGINALGQYEALNQDLSGLDEATDIREVPTELDVVVQHIEQVAKDRQITQLAQPWLPPLKERIYLSEISLAQRNWELPPKYQITFGIVDIPSQQAQDKARHDFDALGHLALFSGPAMGKTTFLQTAVMDLVRHNTPDDLHLYLLDFGANGLLPLLKLPHSADIIYTDDLAKIQKFAERMMGLIRERKSLFAGELVATISAYEESTNQHLPRIFIVVDNYEGIHDNSAEELLDRLMVTVSRDGASLGIYILLSTGRSGGLKTQIQANIKTRLALRLTDQNETQTLIGKNRINMEDIPGRGLIKVGTPEVFQAALPVDGTDDLAILTHLRDEVEEMAHAWTGKRPLGIPIVPDILPVADFINRNQTQAQLQNGALPLGLEYDNVSSLAIAKDRLSHLHVLWEKQTVRNLVFEHLYHMVAARPSKDAVIAFDLAEVYDATYEWTEYYDNNDIDSFKKGFETLKQTILTDRHTGRYEDRFVFITDLSQLLEVTSLQANDFAMLYEEGDKVGVHFIYGTARLFVSRRDQIQLYLEQRQGDAIIAMKVSDQNFYKKSSNKGERFLDNDQVYYHHQDEQTLIKITK